MWLKTTFQYTFLKMLLTFQIDDRLKCERKAVYDQEGESWYLEKGQHGQMKRGTSNPESHIPICQFAKNFIQSGREDVRYRKENIVTCKVCFYVIESCISLTCLKRRRIRLKSIRVCMHSIHKQWTARMLLLWMLHLPKEALVSGNKVIIHLHSYSCTLALYYPLHRSCTNLSQISFEMEYPSHSL